MRFYDDMGEPVSLHLRAPGRIQPANHTPNGQKPSGSVFLDKTLLLDRMGQCAYDPLNTSFILHPTRKLLFYIALY